VSEREGLEERAVAFPIARRAPQQAILVAAITEQTAGQHAKAIQARERVARKQRNTKAKLAALASVAPREPLRTLAPEEVEQKPVSGEAHWLLQSMVLGAAPPAIAPSEPALVTLEYKFPLEYQCMLVASS
jgi:alpha-D-ribose 1-methylphosphonate 5-phosphate C-P lyase